MSEVLKCREKVNKNSNRFVYQIELLIQNNECCFCLWLWSINIHFFTYQSVRRCLGVNKTIIMYKSNNFSSNSLVYDRRFWSKLGFEVSSLFREFDSNPAFARGRNQTMCLWKIRILSGSSSTASLYMSASR